MKISSPYIAAYALSITALATIITYAGQLIMERGPRVEVVIVDMPQPATQNAYIVPVGRQVRSECMGEVLKEFRRSNPGTTLFSMFDRRNNTLEWLAVVETSNRAEQVYWSEILKGMERVGISDTAYLLDGRQISVRADRGVSGLVERCMSAY